MVFLCFCEESDEIPVPKPRGYYVITLPEKSYRKWDTSLCPYSFEIPSYSFVQKKDTTPCWWNIIIPKQKATIHISYKNLKKNSLPHLIEDCRTLAIRHQIKATGMEEIPIVIDSSRVYGLLYYISGNTASNLQFYITDSAFHFIRGSLYFNAYPNYDSLMPVLDFLKSDVIHLIRTTRWKTSDG